MPTLVQSDSFVQKMPRSALRHRPIQPETSTQEVTILTPRASQTKPAAMPDMFTTTVPAPTTPAHKRLSRKEGKMRGSWLIYLVLGMLMTMVLLWLGQWLLNWGNTIIEDFKYGYPRTTQIDHFVGNEVGVAPTHFIATNVNGQIYIIEIPGGQPNNSRLLLGPHLVGEGSDLAPVFLSFVGDPHHPDLLVTVDGIQVRFHNTGSTYAPM